jgi:4-hydroxy-2-oxoheptanedioate aldolase
VRKNAALARLKAGKVIVGPALYYGSPDLAESVAHLDFDFVWLDWQHGQFTELTLNDALGRFLAVDSAPLVRVKSHEPGTINRVLDMEAMGVIVPMVDNAEQARAVTRPVYYPPLGTRWGGGVRLAFIGGSGTPEYYANANDEMLLVLMVETERAIADIESIVQVPGVHVVLIGPGDLMIDLKARGRDDAYHEQLVLKVLQSCQRAAVVAGYFCATHEIAEKRRAQGFCFLCCMSDHAILASGRRELRARCKDW